jgi:hypothetical protein
MGFNSVFKGLILPGGAEVLHGHTDRLTDGETGRLKARQADRQTLQN